MTLAAENIALKAEIARLREALESVVGEMGYWATRNARDGLAIPKPQPVDASSLARIARVALDADKRYKAGVGVPYGCPTAEWEDAYANENKSIEATTPNDIALAQAMAGGAA